MVSPEGGHPDLFPFIPVSPCSSDLFRLAFFVCLNTLIGSDFPDSLRFHALCPDFSEQTRTNQGNTFLPTPSASPRQRLIWGSLRTLALATENLSKKSVALVMLNLVGPRFASANNFDSLESIRASRFASKYPFLQVRALFARVGVNLAIRNSICNPFAELSLQGMVRKEGLGGAIRKKWVTRVLRIDSRELFMIRVEYRE